MHNKVYRQTHVSLILLHFCERFKKHGQSNLTGFDLGGKNQPKMALGFAVLPFKEQDKLSDQFFPRPAKILLNETEKFVAFKRKFVPYLLQV